MKLKLTIIILLIGLKITAQITFEKGYIIDNNNNKVECLIENKLYHKNTVFVRYKKSPKGEIYQGSTENIKEFSIPKKIKFKRFDVKLDISSSNNNNLNNKRTSTLINKTIFLEYIIEGDISLFVFKTNSFERFFYKIKNEDIVYLEYKKFIFNGNKVGENKNYLKQLKENISCNNKNFKYPEYNRRSLKKYFSEINKCKETNFTTYKIIKRSFKNSVDINLRAGITNNSTLLTSSTLKSSIKNGNLLGYRYGLELEYFFSKKNNVALTLELNHFSSTNSSEIQKSTLINNVPLERPLIIEHSGLDLALGARFYINNRKNNSKIFFNGSLLSDLISFKNKLEYREVYKINRVPKGYSIGLGYKVKHKYALEIRYHKALITNRESTPLRFANNTFLETFNSSNIELIISYNIL